MAVFLSGAASAHPGGQAQVEYVRPLSDVAHLLSIRQERNLERTLGELFPARTLRSAVRGSGKMTEERITYEVLKQHGTKYAVVIFSGSWKNEASLMAIYRLESGGYPTPIWHTRSWHSNYSDSYHEIQAMPFGKENVILIKEGENGKSPFVIASLFSFHEKRGDEHTKGFVSINDLTPHLTRLKALVDFPLKPLYAQGVKLQKLPDHLLLQAADVELLWNNDNASKAIEFWKYDKTTRKFVTPKNQSQSPAMTRQ
ncbi:MAG: hypothetical protein ACHQM6_04550 [Candidatus Kapaibacterium sp.]